MAHARKRLIKRAVRRAIGVGTGRLEMRPVELPERLHRWIERPVSQFRDAQRFR